MVDNEIIQFEGIGTHWWIKVYNDDIDLLDIEKEVLQIVKEFEQNYSRFIPASFISRLNTLKFIENFPIELFEMVSYSENLKKISNGYFNIFVGSTLEQLGYDKDYSFKAKEIRSINNNTFIKLTKDLIQITKDSSIDLGGLGKGWLIDKIKNYLLKKDMPHFYINGGGDIYASSNKGVPIEFVLENPFDKSEMIGNIKIKNRGIASSSANRRRWKDEDKEYHHLIDPKKNNSSNNNIAGVFTLGNNALEADVASTIIFVSRQDLWEDIAKQLEVEYMVVFNDGNYFKSNGYTGILNT
jgi:thiamine biosynthesis lipoprotein